MAQPSEARQSGHADPRITQVEPKTFEIVSVAGCKCREMTTAGRGDLGVETTDRYAGTFPLDNDVGVVPRRIYIER